MAFPLEMERLSLGQRCDFDLKDFLFSDLNLHQVAAEYDVDNLASSANLDRIGLRCEAELIEKS